MRLSVCTVLLARRESPCDARHFAARHFVNGLILTDIHSVAFNNFEDDAHRGFCVPIKMTATATIRTPSPTSTRLLLA